MQSIRQLSDIGVIVMRVQVPKLHPGHQYLINHVTRIHSNTLIVLGNHGGLPTDRDPLTVAERTEMLRESYRDPNIKIDSLRDHPFSHVRWSAWLDELVEKNFPGRRACMYGGAHDSFLDVYTGVHKKVPVARYLEESGTAQREAIVRSADMTARERAIYDQLHRPSILYSTVDIAPVDDAEERVLGVTKLWFDGKWSFSGGFVDPEKDRTDEDAARRERGEEVLGIKTFDVYQQLGKRMLVDDPRYRNSKDKIFTSLFVTQYRSGNAMPGDDAKGTRWFYRHELESMFVPWHQPLVERLKERWDILKSGRTVAA